MNDEKKNLRGLGISPAAFPNAHGCAQVRAPTDGSALGSRFFLLGAQKKEPKPGKGCGTPFEYYRMIHAKPDYKGEAFDCFA